MIKIIKLNKWNTFQLLTGEQFKWMVPLSFCTASSPDKPVNKILLDSTTAEVTLENVKPGEWVKVNMLLVFWSPQINTLSVRYYLFVVEIKKSDSH